jgi:hypothetical protein
MVNTSRIARKVIAEVLPKLPRISRKVDDVNERIVEIIEEYAPLTRPLGLPEIFPNEGRVAPKPQPLVKTYQFTPSVPAEPFTGSVRFVPQPNNQERITMQPDTGDDMLNELLAAGVSEMEILQIANRIEQEVAAMTPAQRRQRARAIQSQSFGEQFQRQNVLPPIKKKRKVSKYQKRFGIELKKLKKLHPRTKIQNLMKRAHRRTKAALK